MNYLRGAVEVVRVVERDGKFKVIPRGECEKLRAIRPIGEHNGILEM